ncbi:MAG TPA: AtpZ/AtpI family protein [Chloroflexota bacterium]|nr:AtpZ/AtpI family protein [Chloroflexota bacterium]HUM71629.1 AtpZ/AtpI family protein [Chloroflexota bacterium]
MDEGNGRAPHQNLERRIARKEQRKLWARRHQKERVWFGLGMFGIVGWSVAIPTLLGLALGLYIDANWPSRFSWTLMLLVGGVLLGCWNAWHWVSQEQARIEKEMEELPPEETDEQV